MNELSKEVLIARCEAAIKQLEPCTGTAERQSLECFRIALQSLLALRERAEPVAWRWRWSDDAAGHWRYTEERRENRGSVTAVPLYAEPPAPVVPDAIENAIEYIKSIAFHIDENDYHGQHIAHFMQQAIMWLEGDACRAAMLTQATKANNVIGQYQGADGMPHDIVTLGRTASGQSELLSSGPQAPVAWISDSGKSLILDSEIEPCFKFNGWKPLVYQSSAASGKEG